MVTHSNGQLTSERLACAADILTAEQNGELDWKAEAITLSQQNVALIEESRDLQSALHWHQSHPHITVEREVLDEALGVGNYVVMCRTTAEGKDEFAIHDGRNPGYDHRRQWFDSLEVAAIEAIRSKVKETLAHTTDDQREEDPKHDAQTLTHLANGMDGDADTVLADDPPSVPQAAEAVTAVLAEQTS